jgi:hypothetical protein
MSEIAPRRLIQITDVDADGRRFQVLVTADPVVVAATEQAVRQRVAERTGLSSEPVPGEPAP